MEDLSGLEPEASDFVSRDNFPTTLRALLSEMGKTYVPVMLANARAIEQGAEEVITEVEGKDWRQEPFPYQAKCLQSLRIAHARLSEEDQATLAGLLQGTGCEALFARPA